MREGQNCSSWAFCARSCICCVRERKEKHALLQLLKRGEMRDEEIRGVICPCTRFKDGVAIAKESKDINNKIERKRKLFRCGCCSRFYISRYVALLLILRFHTIPNKMDVGRQARVEISTSIQTLKQGRTSKNCSKDEDEPHFSPLPPPPPAYNSQLIWILSARPLPSAPARRQPPRHCLGTPLPFRDNLPVATPATR